MPPVCIAVLHNVVWSYATKTRWPIKFNSAELKFLFMVLHQTLLTTGWWHPVLQDVGLGIARLWCVPTPQTLFGFRGENTGVRGCVLMPHFVRGTYAGKFRDGEGSQSKNRITLSRAILHRAWLNWIGVGAILHRQQTVDRLTWA